MGMRTAIAAMTATVLLGGSALADDYIVVNSTDPVVVKGTALREGAVVPLQPGSTMTVLSASGALSSWRGGEGAVVLPKLASPAQPGFVDALAAIVRRPPPRRITGAMRGPSDCKPAAELATIEDIVAADQAGCRAAAKTALDAYLQRPQAPATAPPP